MSTLWSASHRLFVIIFFAGAACCYTYIRHVYHKVECNRSSTRYNKLLVESWWNDDDNNLYQLGYGLVYTTHVFIQVGHYQSMKLYSDSRYIYCAANDIDLRIGFCSACALLGNDAKEWKRQEYLSGKRVVQYI